MTTRYAHRAVATAALCLASALTGGVADAQVLERPPRVFRGLFAGGPPPDPNRPRQELTLSGSLMGGADSGSTDQTGGAGSAESETRTFGQGSLSLRYHRGTAMRSFTLEGSANGYSRPDSSFLYGSVARFSAVTPLRGRRDTLQIEQRFSFDPVLTANAIQPIDGTAPPSEQVAPGAPSDPVFEILERRAWASQTIATYDYGLTRTSPLSLNYGYLLRQRTSDEEVGGNLATHRFSASMSRAFSRALSAQFGYGFTRTMLQDAQGISTPMTQQTFDIGPQYEKQLTRNRRLVLGGSVGGQYVTTFGAAGLRATEFSYWTPYGQASARVDIGRSWATWVDYYRGSTIAEALSAQTFASDSVTLSVGGFVGTRLDLAFTGGLSTGRDGTDAGTDASYRSSTYAAQARMALTRGLAAVVSYTHYRYTFANTPDLPQDFVPSSNGNSVRVGINVWLPLVGTYTDGGRR